MASYHVLIIDDEDDIREVAKACLELMGGLQVTLASSSQEGLKKAEIDQPDAILLDVMLPDMDGMTVFKKLQENPTTTDIPVILLTAKVQPADQRRFANLGVSAVIAKPFDPVTLASQISEALGWRLEA